MMDSERLRHAERFADLALIDQQPERATELLSRHADFIELEPGASVFCEGSNCPSIAFVIGGLVRVFKQSPAGRQITLYRVHPGEACILTTCCVLRDAGFPANAVVDEPVTALVVRAEVFRTWFSEEASWRSFVVNLFADRLEQVLGLVDAIAFQRTDARLARFLIAHADLADGSVEFTHEHAAQEIGTARETVSRILDRFASSGLVATERGRVRLLDPDRVASIAASEPNRG